MNIALDIILLIVGFALLVKGADFFVDDSIELQNMSMFPI